MKQLFKAAILGITLSTTHLTSMAGTAEPVRMAASESRPSMVQASDVSWKNAPTQTITAGGVSFAYRELGKQNGGTPVVFLVHLAAVLDCWTTGTLGSWMASRRSTTSSRSTTVAS